MPEGGPLNRLEEWYAWLAAEVQAVAQKAAGTFRGAFKTYADLEAVAWQSTDPDGEYYAAQNDWAVVLADENNDSECWRYVFDGDSAWQAEFQINNTPFTTAQWDTINSGVGPITVSGTTLVISVAGE